MPKKGARRRYPFTDPDNPQGLVVRMREHLEERRVKGQSPASIETTAAALSEFILWCHARQLLLPAEVTKPILERYQRALYHAVSERTGAALSFQTQYQRLSILRVFFRWLSRRNFILANPAADLELPKVDKRLPRNIFTAAEAERVLAVPDVATTFGLRDRAILETLYSTGMRRAECVRLGIYDLDIERGTVMIRLGKGRKDRMVPIGERAMAWIAKYLADGRPELAVEPDDGTLFLTKRGIPFSPDILSDLVARIVDHAGISKRGACHMFRHTMATVMLEGGADVRFIQAMLGHQRLTTTEVYTHVSIKKLKEVHMLSHPTALLRPLWPADHPRAAEEESEEGAAGAAPEGDGEKGIVEAEPSTDRGE